jgi:ATP-binding cassette subfamily B protein
VTPNAALKDGFLRVVGLDQKLRQPVAELSGGERKRLQVAMTLVDKPDILLMDEPSAALDSRNKELLAGLLTESFADTCLIMATHDWELVEMLASPSLVAIREGRLQFD